MTRKGKTICVECLGNRQEARSGLPTVIHQLLWGIVAAVLGFLLVFESPPSGASWRNPGARQLFSYGLLAAGAVFALLGVVNLVRLVQLRRGHGAGKKEH